MIFLGGADSDDIDFGITARTSVGVHHMTCPAFFDRETAVAGGGGSGEIGGEVGGAGGNSSGAGGNSSGAVDEGGGADSGSSGVTLQVVQLPQALPPKARYQPIRGIDLLEEGRRLAGG